MVYNTHCIWWHGWEMFILTWNPGRAYFIQKNNCLSLKDKTHCFSESKMSCGMGNILEKSVIWTYRMLIRRFLYQVLWNYIEDNKQQLSNGYLKIFSTLGSNNFEEIQVYNVKKFSLEKCQGILNLGFVFSPRQINIESMITQYRKCSCSSFPRNRRRRCRCIWLRTCGAETGVTDRRGGAMPEIMAPDVQHPGHRSEQRSVLCVSISRYFT